MGVLTAVRRNASALHRNRPFITDLRSGNRTEFTGELFEQWVAKTANYLEAEFGSEVQMHVRLRAHWLWPVLVAALDELEGAFVPASSADVVVRMGPAPDTDRPVLAVHDHPMALPFREPLPALHQDFFLEVRGGGDVRSGGPVHSAALVDDGDRRWSAVELVERTTPLRVDERVAVLGDGRDLDALAAITDLAITPWTSAASLVVSDDPAPLAAERVTTTLDRRS